MVAENEQKRLTIGKGFVANYKSDTYTGPAFQIKHDYWGEVYGVAGTGASGTASSQLYVTNTSDVPISIKVTVDLDDDGDVWDAVFYVGSQEFTHNTIEIGVIQPKDTFHTTYWWHLVNRAGQPYAETFEVTLKILPTLTIDYTNFRPFKDSKSKVTTVE